LLQAFNHLEEQARLVTENDESLVEQKGFDASQNCSKIENFNQNFDRVLVFVRKLVEFVLSDVDDLVLEVDVDLRIEYWGRDCPQESDVRDDIGKHKCSARGGQEALFILILFENIREACVWRCNQALVELGQDDLEGIMELDFGLHHECYWYVVLDFPELRKVLPLLNVGFLRQHEGGSGLIEILHRFSNPTKLGWLPLLVDSFLLKYT